MQVNTDRIYKNKMGMFDFIKGVTMFCVVLLHTVILWEENEAMKFFCWLMMLVSMYFMSVFFLTSGYWFAVKDTKQFIKQQTKYLFRYYIPTAVIATLCYMLIHYLRFSSVRDAFKGGMGIIIAFFLGCKTPVSIGNLDIYDIGPMWFLVTLCFGAVLLCGISNTKNIQRKRGAIIALAFVGILIGKLFWIPFCINVILSSVLCLYVGYELKQRKYLISKWTAKDYLKLSFFGVFCTFVMVAGYGMHYQGVQLQMVFGIPVAILILRAGLKIDRMQNKVTDLFRKMGRYSIYILMFHTVEMLAVDWTWILNKFSLVDYPWLGFGCVLVIRWILILIGCVVFNYFEKMWRKWNSHELAK